MSDIKATVKKLSDTQVEIECEIPSEKLESYRKEVLKKFGENVKIDGFRPGHIPEDVLTKHVGSAAILQEMAELAIRDAYPEIVKENKIDAIDRPEIAITKLADNNPLNFKVTQSVLPEIKLPDYKKIAAKVNQKLDKEAEEIVVTDKELDEVINNIRNSRKKNPGDEKEIAPALDDEFVKTLGDFISVDDFKTKLRSNLKTEKEMKEKDKRRMAIIEGILKETKIEPPEVMVERQIDQFMAESKGQIAQMGLNFEDYLKHAKKTEEELRKDAREDSKKRVSFNLLLEALAKDMKAEAPKEEVDKQVKIILETYKDASEAGARNYVEGILRNDQVFKTLEETK